MIAGSDSSLDVIDARLLRERLTIGEPIAKTLIIRSATVDFLTYVEVAGLTRRELVKYLFQHTCMWVTFARNATKRALGYKGLTVEQVALILIYRHRATVTAPDAVPVDWHHEPDLSQRARLRHRSTPVVAVWIDREYGRQRQIHEDFTPGYFTWPLEIDALSIRYRPETSSAERKQVHALLRTWAPHWKTVSPEARAEDSTCSSAGKPAITAHDRFLAVSKEV